MSLIFYQCMNCSVPLFSSDRIISTNPDYNTILYNNSNRLIPSTDRNIECYGCETVVGIKMQGDFILFYGDKLIRVVIRGTTRN